MPYVGQTITEVFPTSISVDSATIKGDTTIGDASAADKKILFDGNAVDYHIGLDDSADSLTIGKGSALGTTTSMAINADGIITKPLQPAFNVKLSGVQSNLPLNGYTTVKFDTEIFDNNSDFTLSTGDGQGGDSSNLKAEFTAPVTGRYQLNAMIYVSDVDTATQYYQMEIKTSNRIYYDVLSGTGFSVDALYHGMSGSVLADMDAGDTVSLQFQIHSTGTAQFDVQAVSTFSGYLVA